MTINRDEFDALVVRVAQLEHRHDAAMELIAAELVGLRSHIDTTVGALGDRIEGRLDAFGDQFVLHGRTLNRIADHLGLGDDNPEPAGGR